MKDNLESIYLDIISEQSMGSLLTTDLAPGEYQVKISSKCYEFIKIESKVDIPTRNRKIYQGYEYADEIVDSHEEYMDEEQGRQILGKKWDPTRNVRTEISGRSERHWPRYFTFMRNPKDSDGVILRVSGKLNKSAYDKYYNVISIEPYDESTGNWSLYYTGQEAEWNEPLSREEICCPHELKWEPQDVKSKMENMKAYAADKAHRQMMKENPEEHHMTKTFPSMGHIQEVCSCGFSINSFDVDSSRENT